MVGIFFGMGFFLIFMVLFNYFMDVYEVFVVFVNVVVLICWFFFVVVLFFVIICMFVNFGIVGVCLLFGGFLVVMCILLWFFIWKGLVIRFKLCFCIVLKERKVEV